MPGDWSSDVCSSDLVFTNGCFDILHVGHVTYLEKARNLGKHLIVGLNTDASVRRLKGETRPLVHEPQVAEGPRHAIAVALVIAGALAVGAEDPRYVAAHARFLGDADYQLSNFLASFHISSISASVTSPNVRPPSLRVRSIWLIYLINRYETDIRRSRK